MTSYLFTWIFSATVFHALSVMFVSYHCLIRRRETNSAVLWIFLTWSFPLIGIFLFLFFGLFHLSNKGWEKYYADEYLLSERRNKENTDNGLACWLSVHDWALQTHPADDLSSPAVLTNNAISALSETNPLLGGNSISLLVTGDEAYPSMLQAIENAEDHIHLQSFIIGNDKIGLRFMEALAAKAIQGVRVKVLYDNLGSTKARWGKLFRKFRKTPNLRLAPWAQVNLFKREFQVNLRNHRKIMIVDGKTAFIGGINISNINITRNNKPPIRDYHFKLNGPIVQELQYVFLRDWHFMTEDQPKNLLNQAHFPDIKPAGSSLLRVINSGPTTTEMEALSHIFFNAITAAKKEIILVTPYFVPSQDLIQALRAAAMHGAKVQITVPEKNNHITAGLAGRSLYGDLLKSGVEIYERRPPFMHAKSMIIDQQMALIGTANFDTCSLKLDYETNLAVFDRKLISELYNVCQKEIEDSRQITLQSWLERPTHRILLENFCGLLSPVL